MILIPAIDLKGGKVVRLFQGKFSEVTEYSDDPVQVAKKLEGWGAKWLHLVDLDGAETESIKSGADFFAIVKQIGIPVEVGGGIRSREVIERLFTIGVARVILGTKAVEDLKFLKDILALYGDKICVSLDCLNGFVTQRGWVSTTNIKATDFVLELEAMGLKWMVYTDIVRDGTLAGPNFDELQTMLDTVKKINLIASGGISSLEDVMKLKDLKSKDGKYLWGAITGKAIYEGKLDFKEAVKLLNAQ